MRDQAGLSLLDLLIGMAIFGLLFVIAVPALSNQTARQAGGAAKDGEPAPVVKPDPVVVAPESPVDWSTIFGVIGLVGVAVLVLTGAGFVGVRTVAGRRTAAAVKVTVRASWDQAIARHMAIKESYAILLGDPIAALTHSALWDVSNARTQAFHVAYTRVQDIYALTGDACPVDRALVEDYAADVRKAETLWEDAVAHSEQLGYDWMPHEDKTAARRATAMLKTAANSAASEAERALAAAKAKELIESIVAVRLKTETLTALAASVRLALPAGAVLTEKVSTEKVSTAKVFV